MEGGERQRYCQVCEKTVHNLSAMTPKEAQAVLERRRAGQRLCVRYSAREDGEIRFQRPALIPAGLLVRTREVALRATLAAVAVAAVAEVPGCVPAGPVTGAAIGRVAAEEVVDKLGESGTCSISLEPLLPISLRLHAAACGGTGAELVETKVAPVAAQAPALPEPPPAPEPPTPPEPPPVQTPQPQHTALGRPRSASSPKKTAPKKVAPPRIPREQFFMGDIAAPDELR